MLFSHGLRAASIYAKETSPESFACKLREKIKPNRESLTKHGSKKKEAEDCKASRAESGEKKGGETKTGKSQRYGQ
jgi:hypothetical protein